MTDDTLQAVLADIQAQLAVLTERVRRLEGVPEAAPRAETPAPPQEAITEEEMLAISAALGAYFGVRVHIRQIRLIGSSSWSQQGRVSIQASHRLER
jgi:methylmalonyl-CoA carboxyltransferase 12S subunit